MLIRDFDKESFEKRKQYIESTVAFLNKKYGGATFEVSVTDSYYNMLEIIEKYPEITARIESAMRKGGREARIRADTRRHRRRKAFL